MSVNQFSISFDWFFDSLSIFPKWVEITSEVKINFLNFMQLLFQFTISLWLCFINI